ncbi:MAG: DALR anticodon-binding domain-containing protein [Tepidisphaeraceae bacterium]
MLAHPRQPCACRTARNSATRSSRLSLSDLTARTFELSLDLLGIEHPDQM